MILLRHLRFSATLGVCAALSVAALAQQVKQREVPAESNPPHSKIVPTGALEKNLSLPVGGNGRLEVEVIPPDAMTPQDRELAAAAEPEIRRRAALELLPLDEPGWTFHQLACSAFPHTLLLRYQRDGAVRSSSMFSAVIAHGDGTVRVIPLSRKGYSLFSPAPVNTMSVAAVNRMLAREDQKPAIDAVGVCYAALTGAPAQQDQRGKWFVRLAGDPIIQLKPGGQQELAITTDGLPPQSWNLDFGRYGTLVKATSEGSGGIVVKTLPPMTEPVGKPVPPAK